MKFPIDAVQIDFDGEISYGHDQANVTYPTVFPTVSFPLKPAMALTQLIKDEEDFDPEADYEFCIGINGFTKSKLDNCITAVYQDESLIIDLEEDTQLEIFKVLDTQCREHLGKRCEDLLAEAETKI